MRDYDIRKALVNKLKSHYAHEQGTIILNELSVCGGQARIDIAVINGHLIGYEIKSEHDTLNRLQRQVVNYCKVFDYINIVTPEKHMAGLYDLVPSWWGVLYAESKEQKTTLTRVRNALSNPSVSSYSVAQLLWRKEALTLLSDFNMLKGYKSKPKTKLWAKLANSFGLKTLKDRVREMLLSRQDWRSDLIQM